MEKLLSGCYKFNTWASRLEKQAEKYAKDVDGNDSSVDEKLINKYKGDGFELFVEFFIRLFGGDILIQIYPYSYEIIDVSEDYGVDGKGIGDNGKVHTVQVKYRQSNYILSANEDHLTNFTSLSFMPKESGGFGVDPNYKCPSKRKRIADKANVTIIHSGKEIHYKTKDKMLSNVREINRKDIRNFVDDNHIFWDTFRESCLEARKNLLKE